MKKLLALVLALVLVCAMSVASAEVVLQLAETHAEGYPTTLADQEFARLVEERTEGRVKIEVYSGSQLADSENTAIEKLQKKIEAKMKADLSVGIKVKLVEPQTIERSIGKAKRVIDNRHK